MLSVVYAEFHLLALYTECRCAIFTKLQFFVTHERAQKARVFAHGKPFQPRVM
jgi:hypothetical protein